MNKVRLEELKKILNERRQNLEQGLREDFSAQNFDIPNSDVSDLNSSNSKILNFNDKNSDGSNSNTKDDSKFQNLYSSQAASNKNSKTQARDYDKEPLILRNYTSWALFIHFLLIFAFWVIVSAFVLNKFDEFEDGNLEIGIAIQTALSFGFITTLILILDFKNILSIKPHYTHFYNSKVVFYNHNNKIDETIHFQVMGDRIVLHNPSDNPIGYDISHVKKEGKMVFCSFMRIITTTGFGWAFLSAFTIINFVSRYSFGPFLLSVLITIFTLFLAEFLEILVFMGIYKKSNKTLKNF